MVALEFWGIVRNEMAVFRTQYDYTIRRRWYKNTPSRLLSEFKRQRIQPVGLVCIVSGKLLRLVKNVIKHVAHAQTYPIALK
jgi:hypothetical protein